MMFAVSHVDKKNPQMGGFQLGKWGYPKCLVFVNGKIPSFEMDDDWGYPYDSGNHHTTSWVVNSTG